MQQQVHMDSISASSGKSSSGPSWLADLDAYIISHPTGVHSDEQGNAERRGLVAAVKGSPQSAEAWRALLAYEEAHSSNLTQQQPGGGDPSRVSLYHLHYYATQLVPRNKNQQKEAYLQLWLGFARQQWARSHDDARDTFKTLKNQHIGDASARLYYEWAVLEHSAGNISKALGIIAKGMRADAQPASLLQQLQSELQSDTFDLKAVGPVTETITLDAGALVQQVATTPAPSTGLGLRAGPGQNSMASTMRAPPSVLATAAQARPSSIASCLKAPAAAGVAAVAGHQEHHVARAVTFAADVHDNGLDIATHGHPHRAGSVSACSQRSTPHTVEGHSGCLSNVSSSPSRSMASVHDGTMPFSSGAVSYKSSTTESSTIDGLEEATISCGVTAAAAGTSSRGAGASKPSTAPLAGISSATPATGSNTATLGLKRFGFKSRALRVGGAVETPAAALAAAAAEHAAPSQAATNAAGAVQASSSAAGAAEEDEGEAAAGRKRRAAANSVPSPSVSPKLAAALRDGYQCRVQPGEEAGAAAAIAASSRQGLAVQSHAEQRTAGSEVAAQQSAPDACTSTDDDSVPLVGSKLAARVSQDRGTPMAARKARDAVAQDMGLWISPAEGQVPSSLETTPSDFLPAAAAAGAGGSHTGSRHASKVYDRGQLVGSSRQQQQQQQRERSRQPLAAVPSPPAPLQGALDSTTPPPPTVVLPDASVVPSSGTGAGQTIAPANYSQSAAHGRSATTSSNCLQQQPPQQAATAAAREPLRPLQPQQQAPAVPPVANTASKVQQPSPAGKPAPTNTAATANPSVRHRHQQQVEQEQVQRPAEAPLQQQQQQARQRAPQQQPTQQPRVQQQQQQAEAFDRQPRQQAPQPQAPPQQASRQQVPQQQQQQQAAPAVRQLRPKEDPQTVFVQGVRYHKLECVGRGGSSKVFKVMGPGCKIYALKRIKLAGRDEEAASGFIDEINLLNSLKNKPNIIQLVESQVFTDEGLIYMVQEYGEIDLARLLAKHDAARKEAGALKDNIDENFIRLYWQQMLQAVAGVHEQRIVHSDLKPANFLLVEGQLKLIDFGIAKAISGDTTSIARESQVGTLNYMSPEAILGGTNNILGGPPMKVGRPSDVWSLGCILYQMVYGRTPFADLPFVPKMHAICNPHHRVSFPELANKDLMDVMRRCLDRDPKSRITLQELLDHTFLHPNRVKQAAPAAAAPALSEEQMKLLVAQVQAAGAAGVTDLDRLTRELMAKLGAAKLNSNNSSPAASGQSSPRASTAPAPNRPQQQRDQQAVGQQRQGTGNLSVSGSSKSRIPAAAPGAQPGWR